MAYAGKFKDRNPYQRAAGTSRHKPTENVANCLKYVTLAEEVDAVVGTLPKFLKNEYPPEVPKADLYCGYYTKVRSLISPPKKSFVQGLESELLETAYGSYWTRELGSLPDQVPGLPFGMSPTETIFGRKTAKDESVRELLNPQSSAGEINLIAELGHELYRKSHNSFFPGEQKVYNYPTLSTLKKTVHGMRSYADPDGKLVPRALTWKDLGDFTVGPQKFARYKQRNTVKVGEAADRNKYSSKLNEVHGFGERKHTDESSVERSLRFCDLSQEKKIIHDSLTYINGLRRNIRKQDPPFSFVDFTAAFRTADIDKCKCVPLDKFYKVSEEEGLHLDHELIEPLLKKTGLLHGQNNLVNYYGFVNLIDTTHPLPNLGKIQDLPEELTQLESTYHSLHLQNLAKKEETDKIPPAGIPANELRYSCNYLKQAGLTKANLNDFPTATTVEQCLSPGLFPSLNVSHRDFFQPRSKEYVRNLYERIDVKFSDQMFEKLWAEARRRDGDRVCLETFRNILDEITATRFTLGAEY
ncbi:EF-hand domain-containing family member B-like [Rhodnius prolixus]|uniref:EF-hand domain-containing family member B-like n=1 Tax=Rhodnius prolixus TaxID=13249 RepID=UPI003D18F940